MAALSSVAISVPGLAIPSRYGRPFQCNARERHLAVRAGESNGADIGEKESSGNASISTSEESPSFLLRAAWHGAEALGNITSFFNKKASADPPDISEPFQGPLGRDYVIKSIVDDYEKGYFVTGEVSSGVYEEDCEFADPAGSFKSLKRFKTNCSNFGSLLEKSDVKLMKSEEFSDKFVGYWRFSCVLKFPWRPILASTGYTEYYFSTDTGRVYRHVEHWDVPKMALLGQVFKPNPALKRK